jgi:MoaA/NifB/PqqE/SkfB family radical SAM enzyme
MPVYIDVVGRCNLKCPSCPMGNSFDQDSVGGSMSPELLTRILEKAVREQPIEFVGLYNWTEPLLHPKIGELVAIVKSFGLRCYVSSNLNIAKRLEDVVRSAPDFFRISVSGFTNAVYRQHHSGGDVETVKRNMQALAELVRQYRPATDIEVYYLRWVGNLDEEFLMQEYAESLGFTFTADWAWLSPIEKVIDVLAGDDSSLSTTDRATIESLARPFRKTVEALKPYANFGPCPFFSDYLVLDCTGRVSLCCGVYDPQLYTVGNYLDHSLADLMKMKSENPHCRMTCRQCMDYGLPALGLNVPTMSKINDLAISKVLTRYAAKLGVAVVS